MVSSEGIRVPAVSYMVMAARIAILLRALGALTLAGCASGPSTPAPAANRPIDAEGQDPWQTLVKGATTVQLRDTLGKPAEIRPMESSQVMAEVWIYRRTATRVGVVAYRTEDLPAVDPFTGQQRTVPSPVYEQETSTREEELKLLIVDGRLVTWKLTGQTRRSYE